jgi:hypothetical protein
MLLVTEVAPPHTLPPSNIANSAPCTHLTLGYSPKLVELDFSHLLAKWVGYAPRAPSRRGPISVRLPLGAPRGSQRSEKGLLRRSSGPYAGPHPFGHRLPFVVGGGRS